MKIRIKNPIWGVPVTFLYSWCSTQFKIIGATESNGKGFSNGLWDEKSKDAHPLVNGKKIYTRIFIKAK